MNSSTLREVTSLPWVSKKEDGGDSFDAVAVKNLVLMGLAARDVQPDGKELPAQLNDLGIREDFALHGPARPAPSPHKKSKITGFFLPCGLRQNRFLVRDPRERFLFLGRDSQIHKHPQQNNGSENFLEDPEAAVRGSGAVQPPEVNSGRQGTMAMREDSPTLPGEGNGSCTPPWR